MQFCSIASGSSGNCIYVGDGDTHILIDAGISRRRIVNNLHELGIAPEELDAVLLTHEHSDHIRGLRVFSAQYEIPICSTPGTLAAVQRDADGQEIDRSLFFPHAAGVPFQVGSFSIEPIPISHDAAEPVGYRISSGSRSFAVVTDLGTYDGQLVSRLRGLDGILLEANHDVCMLEVGPYPYPLKRRILGERGHLSNESCGQLLCEILHDEMKQIVLGHLSKENNMAELAAETVRLEVTLSDFPCDGKDLPLTVARRETRTPMLEL